MTLKIIEKSFWSSSSKVRSWPFFNKFLFPLLTQFDKSERFNLNLELYKNFILLLRIIFSKTAIVDILTKTLIGLVKVTIVFFNNFSYLTINYGSIVLDFQFY